MAETCAINFLSLVSYSTSIVIGGLRRLLLPVLMWAGVDLEYFLAETARCSFRGFFQIWSPMEYRSRSVVVLPSIVLFRTIPLQQNVFPPTRALVLCVIAWKSLKMTDFSKTGSRNMAETRAIKFLTPVSYSTSIVIGSLRRLLLPVLMWAGVDLEYFRPETACWSFLGFFFKFDYPWSIVVGA